MHKSMPDSLGVNGLVKTENNLTREREGLKMYVHCIIIHRKKKKKEKRAIKVIHPTTVWKKKRAPGNQHATKLIFISNHQHVFVFGSSRGSGLTMPIQSP